MKSLRLVTSALSVLLALLLLTSVAAASATYLISYGDSLSDNGNLFAFDGGTYPPPPYWMGRMSNGPVMVEYLAQHTGLQLLDFSWIGATTGVGNYVDGGTQTTFGTFGLPGMLTQLAGTIGTITPIASQSVAVVWGGPNDFLTNGFSTATAQLAVNDILSIVATLKGIGMMEIIVPGMPDLSLTPDYYGDLGAQALSIYFNQLLVAGLPQGAQYFNTFAFMHQVVADPGAYGLTDVSRSLLRRSQRLLQSQPVLVLGWISPHHCRGCDPGQCRSSGCAAGAVYAAACWVAARSGWEGCCAAGCHYSSSQVWWAGRVPTTLHQSPIGLHCCC